MNVLSCHVPVTVRIVGRLGDDRLARLAESVEVAVAARLAEAGRTLPDGAVVLHAPSTVGFSGDVGEFDRARLAEAVLAAVARAAGALTAGVWSPALPASTAPAWALNRISASGERPDRAGRPLSGSRRIHGHGAIGPAGEIVEGGSPFDGLPLATLRGSAPVLVASPRHTVSGTLTLAVQFGLVLFTSGSFAVIESPAGVFWTVATDPAVDAAELSAGLLPDAVLASAGTADGLGSRIRVLITRDQRPVWQDRESGVDWLRQLAAEAGTTAPVAGQVQPVGDHPLLTRLRSIAETELSVADAPSPAVPPVDQARRLADILPVDQVRRLVEVLAATPWAEQIRTAMELIAGATDGAYLDALVVALRQTGLHGRLFDDPQPEVYDLLRDVGTRFPLEPGTPSVDWLAVLLRRFDLLPRRLHEEALLGVVVGPQGITVPAEMLAMARESARGLVRAGAALGESITGLFSSPQQQARVLEALAQLLVTVRLGGLGVRAAVRNAERFLQRLPIELLVAIRGAERLAVPDRTLRRLQWRAILQIAFVYGPQGTTSADSGEISGDATAVLAAVSTLVRLGVPVNPGILAARLVTLAGVLAAARPDLGGTDEILERLAGLPEARLRHLGGVLAKTPVAPGASLADLAATAPDLHAATVDAVRILAAGGQ